MADLPEPAPHQIGVVYASVELRVAALNAAVAHHSALTRVRTGSGYAAAYADHATDIEVNRTALTFLRWLMDPTHHDNLPGEPLIGNPDRVTGSFVPQ